MITRVWSGRTASENAEEYGAFLRATAYPDYGGVEGNCGWLLLRRDLEGSVEFVLVSFWDSRDALRRYTRGEPEHPKYYPEDRRLLLELPDHVDHYTVVDSHVQF